MAEQLTCNEQVGDIDCPLRLQQRRYLLYIKIMMGKNKSGLLDDILAAKLKVEKKLQNAGAKIRENVKQGQEDFKSGKTKYYGSINPFKGIFK